MLVWFYGCLVLGWWRLPVTLRVVVLFGLMWVVVLFVCGCWVVSLFCGVSGFYYLFWVSVFGAWFIVVGLGVMILFGLVIIGYLLLLGIGVGWVVFWLLVVCRIVF